MRAVYLLSVYCAAAVLLVSCTSLTQDEPKDYYLADREQSADTETVTDATDEVQTTARLVEDADPEKVSALAESVFNELFPDGIENLSERDRARVVYDWVTQNIRYVNMLEEREIMFQDRKKEAIWEGLSSLQGNCYTYFAVSDALLRCAGLEVRACRSERPTPNHIELHFWNLVLIEDEWLHFDTTPNFDGTIMNIFLLSNEEIAARHGDEWVYTVSEAEE